MSKEKQIEEMAKVIDDIAHNAYIENYDDAVADSDKIAKDLYNAGYRKQSDLTPCDVCRFNPPSSGDGKPCTVCPAQKKGE